MNELNKLVQKWRAAGGTFEAAADDLERSLAAGKVATLPDGYRIEVQHGDEQWMTTAYTLVTPDKRRWSPAPMEPGYYLLAALSAPPADPAKASGSAPCMQNLYDAAAKGFHTSESCGPDGEYMHVSKFKTLQDLQDFHRAWTDAMVSVRDATPPASASEVTDALGWLRSALDCPTFAWDADQRAAAEAALTAALLLQGKSHG